MRLLMLNNEFPPLGGGTGTVTEALLRCLSSRPEIEVELVTSAPGAEHDELVFAPSIRIVRVPVPQHDIHHASNRALATYALRAYRESVKRHRIRPYDLCFAWSAVPAGTAALALDRMTGLRYLVRVSGPDIPGFERRYQWLYPALTPIIRATWRSAAVLVAKCESEAAMIRAVDGSIGIRIIPNGVDVGAFPESGRTWSGPVRLLCVARLIERKGQHDLLRALRSLIERGIDARLELVGEGDARGSLEQLASSLGVRHLVHFAGYVPRDAIPRKYADADVFVLPSYNEGMSVATLEAMASGLPVIVTRVGGVDELVAEGVNGLTFDWGDVKALASCLELLARDPDRRRRLGQASRVRATAFSWERMTRAYVELIDELGSVRSAQAPRSQPIAS